MKILAIETSCDETAIAIIEALGNPKKKTVSIDVLANVILSQIKIHKKYGGVFPALAKREHARNLVPVLKRTLEQGFGTENSKLKIENFKKEKIKKNLEREPELAKQFFRLIPFIKKPPLDAIAVTFGPGLEPALWVGINFAKALSLVWNIPVIPVNHMEGHVFSALLKRKAGGKKFSIFNFSSRGGSAFGGQFPILALLISGGHTELVLMKKWLDYQIVGETKDDAAGEAFDKVARMLGLPYPGGPAISAQARKWRGIKNYESGIKLPRPMINSNDFNFSFSGLKTAVLYRLKEIEKLTPKLVQEFSYEFEEAVTEVLVSKTIRAAKKYGAKTILVGGGVSANQRIRDTLIRESKIMNPELKVLLSPLELTGDNALMIAVAAYLRHALRPTTYNRQQIKAEGNARLS